MVERSLLDRRTLLQTTGAVGAAAFGLGSASATESTDDATQTPRAADPSPIPVIDESGNPEETISILVTVTDEDGTPLEDELVELEDRGGSPDDRYGRTGATGQLLFLEDVGPAPCNRQTLKLPDRDESADLGCNDGGVHLEHTFEVSSMPVVDNSSSDPDETLTVDVTVEDADGTPLEDVLVELQDRGGTPDDRTGRTGPKGRLRFLEDVGPAPCNTQTLKLPDHGETADLGCNNGGTHLEHAFEVGSMPVVDNSSSNPGETVTIDVTVEDESGEPLAGEPVKLEDRGGSPDDEFGETGPEGRLRFLENVGPAPCNTQTLKLPERGESADLGCNNGGVHLEHTFAVETGSPEPIEEQAESSDRGAEAALRSALRNLRSR